MGEVSYLPLIENMTWSYSRIECFSDCPYRFYLKYIGGCQENDRFYASYGNFMHGLIERYYRNELSQSEMLTEFLVRFSDNVKGTRPAPGTVEKYIESGAKYLQQFKPFTMNMLSVEKRVDFEVDGLRFIGFIDYLGEKDGNLYIVDHKSRDLKPRSKRANPTVKDKELDKMLRQLYLYAEAIKQEYGKFPKSLCFNCFRTGVFIEEPFQEHAYREAMEWFKNSIDEIKTAEDFPPQLDFFACRYICGVSEECVYNQTALNGRRGGK